MVSSIDTYLGATQLGITLASLALGWLGEPAVASLLKPIVYDYLPGSPWLHSMISVILAFVIITFMHIVIGELVPKQLAIQKVESLALLSVGPLYIFHKLGYPVIVVFNRAAKAILGVMGIDPANNTELAHSEDELRMIVSASQRGGVLDQMESKLIDNVFDFADRLVREVMVPRQDINCLFVEDSFEDNMQVILETGHTRYPLCVEDKDHVIGMIHLRDIIDLKNCRIEEQDLRHKMREILVVPEGMPVANLLQVMQKKRTHMAIVADEYGGTAGLVCLEDVIEEIVGDIQDEYDHEEIEIQRFADGTYEFDGVVLLDDVAELLNIPVVEHEEDTIGGYIFGLLGRRPEIGDEVEFGEYQFSVKETAGYRVVRVKATPIPKEPEA